MDRRTFLKWFGAGAAIVAINPEVLLAESDPPMRGTIGNMRVNAHDHGNQYRVYLDGKEITSHCFEADSGENWADVYLRNKKGNFYPTGDKVASRRLAGNVKLVEA